MFSLMAEILVECLGFYVQAYTLYSSGINAILGAVDKHGPALYVEPSGDSYVRNSDQTIDD